MSLSNIEKITTAASSLQNCDQEKKESSLEGQLPFPLDSEPPLPDSEHTAMVDIFNEYDREKMAKAYAVKEGVAVVDRVNSTKLQAASAAGDDRTLASHGNDRKYWYSMGDGYRLLLAIRETLTYTNEVVSGEKYSAHRENGNQVFITDPYHIVNFDSCLEDDIKKIHGLHEIAASNRQWIQLPRIIIIPILTGSHWRCLRLQMDYDHKKIHLLFDDPYGKDRFDEITKTTLKTSLLKNLDRLFIQTKVIELEEQDKVINQQGVGNGYDCGPIVFSNIADYADAYKNNAMLSRGEGLRITSAEDTQHESLMIRIRAEHTEAYNLDKLSFPIHAHSTPLLQTPAKLFPANTFSTSVPGGWVAPSATVQPAPAHPDHLNLQGKNLSVDDLQQLWQEVRSNKLIGHVSWGTLPSGEEAQWLCDQIECQIIQNNTVYQRYPSDFIHGILSLHAYENAEADTVVRFQSEQSRGYQHYNNYIGQWTVHSVHDFPKLGGYYGAIYKNEQTRQLVLAHRGTTAALMDLLTSDSHIKTNIKGAIGGKIAKQHQAACEVTQEAAAYAEKHHYHFSTTGHSLGAWLAEISVYFSKFEFKIPARAVTFESPGSIVMNILDPNIINHENKRNVRDLDITTYLSDPNFVNTCNTHIGKVYRLYPDYKTSNIAQCAGINLAGLWSISGHALLSLLTTFDPLSGKPKKVDAMSRWPVIKYTPHDTLSNAASSYIGILGSQQPLIKNALILGCRYVLDQIIDQTTIGSVINLLIDLPLAISEKRIDLSQYSTCWNILSKLNISEAENILLKDKFLLTYEGSYQTTPIDTLNSQLIVAYKGSIDWYLKKLADCPVNKINQYFVQTHLIAKQLTSLKALYHITLEQGCYQLTAKNISTEEIKERLLRLLEVTHNQVAAFLRLYESQILETSVGNNSESGLIKIPAEYRLLETPTAPPLSFLTSHLPLSLGKRYISREESMKQLDRILAKHPYAIITGEPGFGKTTLALEYGHIQTRLPKPTIVIQISADSQEKIDNEYRKILTVGHPLEKQDVDMIIRLMNHRISRQQEKILLIFDNVAQYLHIAPYLAHLPVNAKALITTRNYGLMRGEPHLSPLIKVEPFSLSEAAEYIKNSAIKNRIQNPEEVEALITYYAKNTPCITPYDLNEAVALIKADSLSNISEYLREIRKHPYDESEMRLQQRLIDKSPLAWRMLQYAAFLDPDAIDPQIFAQLFRVDKSALNEAIKVLESISKMYLIWKNGQSFLSLHRITQRKVKDFIGRPGSDGACMSSVDILLHLAKSLNTWCPIVDSNPGNWPQVKRLMPHIDYVLGQLERLSERFNKAFIAQLWKKKGDYTAKILGLYAKAFHYYQIALKMQQQLYPNLLHPDIIQSLNDIGYVYINLGGTDNCTEAIKLLKQALLTWHKRYSNKKHAGREKLLYHLGLACSQTDDKEKLKEGLVHLNRAWETQNSLFPHRSHPEIALSLYSVGTAYIKLGSSQGEKEGLSFLEKALVMWQHLYPDQPHPELARCLYTIGIFYQELKNERSDISLLEKALAMWLTLYPDQPHPDLACCLCRVGSAYQELDDREKKAEGLSFLEQALTMWRELSAKHPHPHFALALHTLGNAYIKLEDEDHIKKGQALLEEESIMNQELFPNPQSRENQPFVSIPHRFRQAFITTLFRGQTWFRATNLSKIILGAERIQFLLMPHLKTEIVRRKLPVEMFTNKLLSEIMLAAMRRYIGENKTRGVILGLSLYVLKNWLEYLVLLSYNRRSRKGLNLYKI